jgi:hypothetical protein
MIRNFHNPHNTLYQQVDVGFRSQVAFNTPPKAQLYR